MLKHAIYLYLFINYYIRDNKGIGKALEFLAGRIKTT